MRKFWVQLTPPTVYHLDAETEEEAAQKAVERFKQENNTRIDPLVHQVTEFEDDEYLAEALCEGPSSLDEIYGKCVHTVDVKRT